MLKKSHLPLIIIGLAFSGISIHLASAAKTGYAVGHFAISLDGKSTGYVQSFDGGSVKADVITEPPLDNFSVAKKHIGQPKYGDITLNLDLSPDTSPAFYDWIKSLFDRKPMRKSGEIIGTDLDYKVKIVKEFHEAVITEVTFPACEGGSKDPAFMSIKFAPTFTEDIIAAGKVERAPGQVQRIVSPTAFRLSIEGLDEDTKRIAKVDAITIKQGVVKDDVGTKRDYEKEPAKLEIPNLSIHLPLGGSPGFQAWADTMVAGANGKEQKRSGVIEYYNPQTGAPYFSILLLGVGIYQYNPMSADCGTDCDADKDDASPKPDAQVGLYVEDMKFYPGQIDKAILEKLYSASRGGQGKWVGFAGKKGGGASRGIASVPTTTAK